MAIEFYESKFDKMVQASNDAINFLNAYDLSVEDPNETNDEIVAREIQTYNDGMDWFDALMKRQAEDAEAYELIREAHRPLTRGIRRYQTQKLKRRMIPLLNSQPGKPTPKSIGKLASVHGVPCSCHMCGNPRKTQKGRNKAARTIKEQYAIKAAKEVSVM